MYQDEEPGGEERPSIIQDIVFYEKPGILKSTEADLFERRRSRRLTERLTNLSIKLEPDEVSIKSEVTDEGFRTRSTLSFLHSCFIQSEDNSEQDESRDESNHPVENVVEIFPSDISDNTKQIEYEEKVKKGLRVYGKRPRSTTSTTRDYPDGELEEEAASNRRGRSSKMTQKSVKGETKKSCKETKRKVNDSEEPKSPTTTTSPKKKMKKETDQDTSISKGHKDSALSPKNSKQRQNKAVVSDSKIQEEETELIEFQQAESSATPKKQVMSPKLEKAEINNEKYSELVQKATDQPQKSPLHKSGSSSNAAADRPVPINVISVQTIKKTPNSSGEKRIVIQSVHAKGSPSKSTKPAQNDSKKTTESLLSDTDGEAFKIVFLDEGETPELESDDENRKEWVPDEYVEYKQKHATKVYRCDECKQDFATQNDIMSHAEETEHTTQIDNEIFFTAGGVEVQKVSSNPDADVDDLDGDDDRPEWIPDDYAEYKQKHLISASSKRPIRVHKCKICLEIFKSYYLLCKHKVVHLTRKNPYECRQCDDSFDDLEKFTAHIRMHQGKNPYPCKKCEMGFLTKSELEDHSKVHILKKNPPKAKRFRCDICGKEFSKLCDMERHTRVHTGEKPAECNICHKRFQQTHNLSKHLLTHLQVKPFQCDICNKKFGRVDVLNRHLLTHSLVKPFKCQLCTRGFIRQIQLDGHVKKNHPQAENSEDGEENHDEDGDVSADIVSIDNEEVLDITPVEEIEADVPEEIDLVKDLVEHNKNHSSHENESGNRIEMNFEDVDEDSQDTETQEDDNESVVEARSPEDIERVPHTSDPNLIMERILNPEENAREQTIDEIN